MAPRRWPAGPYAIPPTPFRNTKDMNWTSIFQATKALPQHEGWSDSTGISDDGANSPGSIAHRLVQTDVIATWVAERLALLRRRYPENRGWRNRDPKPRASLIPRTGAHPAALVNIEHSPAMAGTPVFSLLCEPGMLCAAAVGGRWRHNATALAATGTAATDAELPAYELIEWHTRSDSEARQYGSTFWSARDRGCQPGASSLRLHDPGRPRRGCPARDRAEQCGPHAPRPTDPLIRNRRSVGLNLKDPAGIELLLQLTDAADVLVEGFRPGVAERLGFGPEVTAARNPRLIFARMTGWGQDGPLAPTAGHDINYIAVSGALSIVGRAGESPVPPVNLVGDFGGGGMLMALGVLAAVLERDSSGHGQVVDAAMVDGSALLTSFVYGLRAAGIWQDARGSNRLDGGAPFYDTYVTADGEYVAVGALEPQFYAELLDGLGLADADLPDQLDRSGWPVLRRRFADIFASRTRAEWEQVFTGADACVSPVLTLAEATGHPHAGARNAFIGVGGITQPAPAPRFSRTAVAEPTAPPRPGADTDAVLASLGLTPDQLADLRSLGVVG